MGKKKKVPAALTSQDQITRGLPMHGVWGVALLIVAASILYANYRVFFGVEELIPRLMLAPSTAAVVVFLVYKAVK